MLATQNPIESEGTYPLPGGPGRPLHAQGARRLPGPRRGADGRRALARAAAAARSRCSRSRSCRRCRRRSRKVYVDPALISWVVDLATATRKPAEHGLDVDRAVHLVRREPARADQRVAARARARAPPRPRLRARRPTSRRSSATPSGTGSSSPTRRSPRRSPPTRCSTRCSRRRSAADRPRPDRAPRGGVKGAQSPPSAASGRPRARAPGRHGREPRGARARDRPARRRAARRRLPLGVRRASAASSTRCGRTSRATTSAGSTGTSPRAPAQTHVRVELAERVLVTWLVFDASASMAFGTADRRKADVAEGVALAVGHAATRRGNRLGLVAFGAEDPQLAPAAAGPARPAADARGAARGARRATAALGEALALARRPRGPALARRHRLRLPRPDRLAQRRCCASPAAIRRSRSRSATRASRSSPTSASCGSSTPRPAASCASTRATAGCASASPRPRREERAGLVRLLSVGRRPPRRALDRGRLAARRSPPSCKRSELMRR